MKDYKNDVEENDDPEGNNKTDDLMNEKKLVRVN